MPSSFFPFKSVPTFPLPPFFSYVVCPPFYLPFSFFLFRGCHSLTILVHFILLSLVICPFHLQRSCFIFYFLNVRIDVMTSALLRSFKVIPAMLLFIDRHLLNFFKYSWVIFGTRTSDMAKHRLNTFFIATNNFCCWVGLWISFFVF